MRIQYEQQEGQHGSNVAASAALALLVVNRRIERRTRAFKPGILARNGHFETQNSTWTPAVGVICQDIVYSIPHTRHCILQRGRYHGQSSKYHAMKCWQDIEQIHVVPDTQELDGNKVIPMFNGNCQKINLGGQPC